jgi:hypothetical protein
VGHTDLYVGSTAGVPGEWALVWEEEASPRPPSPSDPSHQRPATGCQHLTMKARWLLLCSLWASPGRMAHSEAGPAAMGWIDVGGNLLDGMYGGRYGGSSPKHEPDLPVVLERAWASGVQHVMITGEPPKPLLHHT